MTEPKFFANGDEFRQWLEENAATASEVFVGYYKVATGRPSMTWSESVDEALCFGWIDGIRRRIDDEAYQIRFTPRRPGSNWSAVNIAKIEKLRAEGRMTEAGEAAYAKLREGKAKVYAYEQRHKAEFTPEQISAFESNPKAWKFFQEETPPSYRKTMIYWVTSAKKPETRASRFAKLVEACEEGKRLK